LEEIEKMIAASVETVESNMHSTYVVKQKIHDNAYHDYFLAIRDMLTTEYVHNDGVNRSYYDYLHQHIQTLTRDDYQRQCRCYFEYLAKLARQELLRQLKKEW
jgi:arabinogalactan endo-1,4-beta-galactosidase